ncbi:MAG: DUF5013 domain-containing protein [Bacteroidaceae bacterium]|nr:DUF5013 domain-containing protein [Bacteroidaceae bacterium]
MKKLLLFLSVLWFGLAQASAETYDVDKTDAVDVSPAAWGGGNTYNYDVTTSDGRATKMVEHYYAQLAQNEELPLKQTVTGLPNGKYTVTLIAKTNCANWDFDVPADFVDGSYDYASVFACPGASYSPAKAVTKAIEADIDRGYARAPQEYTIDVTVTDGSLTLGMVLHDMNKTNWHTIQIKSLILHSDVPVTEPVNVTSATGLSVNNATVWKRDNNAGNWQNIPNSGTDNWEQWQGAPGTLNNRIMYRTVQLPAGTYTVKASINALQQNGDDATDKNIDFYVQSGSDVQKVNCYGDFAARELEITLGEAAEVEIGIRAYAAGTANWIAQKNLRLYTTSYSTIEEFEAAYAPLKLAGAYSDLEYAYNSAIDKLDEDGKAHFIELAAAIKAALDGKTYTTEAEINQAIKDVQTYLVQSAYYVEGEDMTSLIKNAAIANGNDWETPRTNSGQQYNGAPDNTYLDFWNNSGNIVKTSQKITVPAGTYALLAATRSSNGEEGKIYAIVGETEFSAPIFKDGAEGGQLGGGWSVTKVKDIVVPEEQEIEIGFYCPTPDGAWAGADDFRLIKTGEAALPGTLTADPKEINFWGFTPATELYYNTHKAIFHVEAENLTENITYVMKSSGKAKGSTTPRITVATSGLYEAKSGNLNVTCSSSKLADISDVVIIKSGDVTEEVTVNVKIANTQYNGEGIFEEDWEECRPFTVADVNAIHTVMPKNTTWATDATHEYSMYFPKLRYFQGVVSAVAADADGKVTFTLADAEGDATVKVVEALYKEGQTALKAGDKVILSGDFGDVEGELQILTSTIEEITAAPADDDDDTTDGVIFKWDNVTGADDYVAEAGTIECLGGDKNDRLNYANAALGVNYKTICLNGKKGNLGDGTTNGTYMKVTPTQALKAGDVIAMTAYRNKDAMGKKASAALVFSNGASAVIGADPEFPNLNAAGENPTGAPETIELVVTEEMAGAASINLSRQDVSTNLFITSLIITTTPDEPAADNVEWDPAPGEVDYNAGGKLDQVILTFTDAGMVELNEIPFKANIEDENGNEVDFMYGVNFYFLGMNQACITFNKGVQADGTYTVNVPAGLFTLVMPDGTTKASSELHATYIVTGAGEGPVAGGKIQIDPAEGEVTSLQKFALIISDWDTQFDNYNSQAKFYKDGEFVEDVAFDFDPEDWFDSNLYGSLSKKVVAKGTYTLEFPIGSMTTNSWASSNTEPVVYTWTILEDGEEEEELPTGTYAAPIALEDGKTYGLNAAVTGAPNFYTFESDKDVKIILTPTEGSIVEGGFAVSTGNFLMDDQYNDLEGAEMIETMMEPVEGGSEPGIGGDDDELGGDFGWGMAPGRMATTWTAKAGVKYYIMTMGQGAFDVALGEPEEYVGTIDTPINLNETPEWTWGTDGKLPGGTTYYTYTAEKDGNLTIFVSNCAENQLNVGEGGWYDQYVHTEGPAYTGEIKTEYDWAAWTETNTFAVEAGTTYYITIFDLYDETIKATFEEATGIKGAAADKANGTIFNVSGQKVDKTAKGILIINGRKVLKK